VTSAATRPLPKPTPISAGFWEAAARRELVLQRCHGCRAWRHYPQPMCSTCHSLEWGWEAASGHGEIYSFVVAHRAFHAFWADKVPYVIATIELEEGVRMVDDMLELPPEQARIGLPVEVWFAETSDGIVLPKWRKR
jgi:uncharacterized OB-fold protein